MKFSKTVVLLGGSFDPIHHTHLEIASTLDAFYQPNELWFLPAPKPRWKQTQTPFKVRRKDIQLAIQSHSHWKVPLIEYRLRQRHQETYTIDTVRHLKGRHPTWRFILAIGTDQFMKFDQWREADAFQHVVELAVVERPGYVAPREYYSRFQATRVPLELSTLSSAEIRKNGLYREIPKVVAQRIITTGRYFEERVSARLTAPRMEHVRRVTRLAVRLAKAHHVSPDDAYVAAILHDIAREIPAKEGRLFLENQGIDTSSFANPQVHAEHGAWLAHSEFGVTNPSILNAIRYHTFGDKAMDPLAKIIYCADKCESGRGKYTAALRRLCLRDLDQGLLATLKADIDYWNSQGVRTDDHPVLQLIQHLQKEQ